MANFGLDWVVLLTIEEEHLFEYENLLYYHEVPFHTVEAEGQFLIKVPEKFSAIGKDIIEDHRAGILQEPVNNFNPRYSNFVRGLKVRQVGRPRASFKWQFAMILFLMLFMMAMRMLLYLRK